MSRKDDSSSEEGHEAASSEQTASNENQRGNSKRKRDASETGDLHPPPVIVNGMVEFSLAPVNAQLVCSLCSGYFRDPYTIAECLHTFCKSCLFYAFSSGHETCPGCDFHLGPDPKRVAFPDRTLQELVDKVLFPRLQQIDDANEREFYAKREIRLKPEFVEEDGNSSEEPERSRVHQAAVVAGDELNFTLVPDTAAESGYEMPRLERPCIRTSGRFKIGQLKKYLLKQLKIFVRNPPVIEILCNGGPVGNELSLTFVHRTIWPNPKEDLRLTYRFAEDG